MSFGGDDKDRKPLLEKLEPTHRDHNAGWQRHEAQQWSRTGRSFMQMIMDFIRDFWEF